MYSKAIPEVVLMQEKETVDFIHILLADDDADDCMLFNEAIEQSSLPIKFSRAEDGNHLLNMLKENKVPDILFLDVNMPYKNGLECLNEIRSDEKLKDLPVVIYSTTNYKVNIDACYAGGANLYVVKPNTFDDILKMVKKICNKNWLEKVKRPEPELFILQSFDQ